MWTSTLVVRRPTPSAGRDVGDPMQPGQIQGRPNSHFSRYFEPRCGRGIH